MRGAILLCGQIRDTSTVGNGERMSQHVRLQHSLGEEADQERPGWRAVARRVLGGADRIIRSRRFVPVCLLAALVVRVLSVTGLGGYSGHGGVETKIALLKLEGGYPLLL